MTPFRPAVASLRIRPRLEALEVRQLLSGFQPTALEQLFLERLNDARADPGAYGVSIGVDLSDIAPSQPLALDPRLVQSARQHSQDMSGTNYFGHVGSDGSDPGNRVAAAGYPWTGWGESLAAGYDSPEAALRALITDAGEPSLVHRMHLLAGDATFSPDTAAGVGIAQGNGSTYSSYYTIDTGVTNDTRPYLTGVVFADSNGNGVYDVGEGKGGVTIAVNGLGSTTTFDSGGYSIQLAPGTYTVTATGGGLAAPITEMVTVGASNRRLNFNTLAATPPVLGSVADQIVPVDQDRLSVPLSIAGGDAGTISARAGNLDGLLRETLGLRASGNYYQNWGGLNEKWIEGSGGQWYYLLPNGQLYRWQDSDPARNPLVATLDTGHWADPNLLTKAWAGGSPASIAINGNQLTINPADGYAGTFGVAVTVRNGSGSDTKFFAVTVPGAATLASIAQNAAAPVDSAPSSVWASRAFALKQTLGLTPSNNNYANWAGAGDKWLRGSDGTWYFLLSDGRLYRFNGRQEQSTLIAVLPTAYYQDPSLLSNAQPA